MEVTAVGNCVIFCAAEFDGLIQPVAPEDYLLAADGGLRHLQGLGRKPDLVLGDFDSLGYTPTGAEVHPVEKDDTDSMLAMKLGLEMGFRTFHIYGGTGGRQDHTFANYQALISLARQGFHGYLIGGRRTGLYAR